MKDTARLLAYFAALLVFGALLAPPLYWGAQWLIARGTFRFLAAYEFETFFHRALLIGAAIFFWPLLKLLHLRSWRELGLSKNTHAAGDATVGFLAAALPLFLFGAALIALNVYSLRAANGGAIASRSVSALVVPFIEEPLFRGLILGVLLRATAPTTAMIFTSAIFSVLHFLKPTESSVTTVHWSSGFVSIAHAFSQFGEPLLLLAGFTTLFLLGWILADTRIRTRSLWLPIGLHAGWIFSSALFNKIARRQAEMLPWLGKNLLIGLAPLGVALVTWALVRLWLKHVATNRA